MCENSIMVITFHEWENIFHGDGWCGAESEQSKDELNLETRKLIDAGWIRPSG